MSRAIASREEAARIASELLDGPYDGMSDATNWKPHWHIGLCELRDLLDAIYGPPTCEAEEVRRIK